MTELLLILGFAVWLGAAYAFVQIIRTVHAVRRLAPVGEGLRLSYALMSLNYPAVVQRLGTDVEPHVQRHRKAVRIFVVSVGLFMILLIANIISGRAA